VETSYLKNAAARDIVPIVRNRPQLTHPAGRKTKAVIRRASSAVSIFAVDRRPGDWKRLKARVGVSPTRVLHGRAFAAA
jgi:hypothetical protein